MTRRIARTLTYMEPITFVDGHGFRTIVELTDGTHALISEVNRGALEETVVFQCDSAGRVSVWSEIYSCESTHDAVSSVSDWART